MELRELRYFVTVADESNIGRAAQQLHMTQPPLSRAIAKLETEFDIQLFHRTIMGVELTDAGHALYVDAVDLLNHAVRVRDTARLHAQPQALTIGSLADTVDLVGSRLMMSLRDKHPDAVVRVHESDLTDPSAGLRSRAVDVALTRLPFDDRGLSHRVLVAEPVGIVVADTDELAQCDSVVADDLTQRRWIRLPDNVDLAWRRYWTVPGGAPESVPVHTISECVQAVLWNGMSALAPLDQTMPAGLTVVPVRDRAPSRLVVAWRSDHETELIRAFIDIAVAAYARHRKLAPMRL